MTKPLIIIPCRMAATRLPNKPLANIKGEPMVVKIAKQALSAKLGTVLIAAGDQEICNVAEKHDILSILTPSTLQTGTDRVAYAAQAYDPSYQYKFIINLQGDLAVFDNDVLHKCLEILNENPNCDVATVCCPLLRSDLIHSSNTVKVAMTDHKKHRYPKVLYFSRSTIPYGSQELFQHIGIYGYTRKSLATFVSLPQSHLELCENLEQLRGLEAGLQYQIAITSSYPLEVNTQEDLDYINKL